MRSMEHECIMGSENKYKEIICNAWVLQNNLQKLWKESLHKIMEI